MLNIEHPGRIAARSDDAVPIDMDATLFVALELSLSSWVVAASAPGEDKSSRHGVAACDGPGLLALLDRLRLRAEQRCRRPVTVAVMQEAGRDGFWGSPPAGSAWGAKLCGRSVVDCDEPPQPAGQDGPD